MNFGLIQINIELLTVVLAASKTISGSDESSHRIHGWPACPPLCFLFINIGTCSASSRKVGRETNENVEDRSRVECAFGSHPSCETNLTSNRKPAPGQPA